MCPGIIKLIFLTMGSQVRDTTNSVALNLNIRAQHLADEGFKTSELDDQELVVR